MLNHLDDLQISACDVCIVKIKIIVKTYWMYFCVKICFYR